MPVCLYVLFPLPICLRCHTCLSVLLLLSVYGATIACLSVFLGLQLSVCVATDACLSALLHCLFVYNYNYYLSVLLPSSICFATTVCSTTSACLSVSLPSLSGLLQVSSSVATNTCLSGLLQNACLSVFLLLSVGVHTTVFQSACLSFDVSVSQSSS